jgi:3-methylcrotonyl-CoA carboxylase beta subunit
MARDIVSSLNQARISDDGRKTYQEPLFPCEELGGIIPTDSKQPFDVRLILARILDGSRFQEYKAKYGTTIVTGFGELYGNKDGIIANSGILFSVELCCQREILILFLQNITGFMAGKSHLDETMYYFGPSISNHVLSDLFHKSSSKMLMNEGMDPNAYRSSQLGDL